MEKHVTKEYLELVTEIKNRPVIFTDARDVLSKTVLSPCSIAHDLVCDCCRKLYDTFRTEYELRALIQFREKSGDEDAEPPEYIIDAARGLGEKAAEKFCKEHDVVCPYEKDELLNTVGFFMRAYPNSVEDPIFIEAVKTVLNLQMVAYRLRRDIGQSGTTVTRYDKNDNPVVEVNPLLRSQREFEQAKLQTLEFLERKLSGSKLDVRIEGNISVSDIMTKIINLE